MPVLRSLIREDIIMKRGCAGRGVEDLTLIGASPQPRGLAPEF